MERLPNIMLIMTDQQRFDTLGCTGMRAIETPNLDRLAREGVAFDRCYVNAPCCTPARASLMTGKYPQDHGALTLRDVLATDTILFSERLRDKGYETALFGKLHVQDGEQNHRHPHDGFDIYEWTNNPCGQMDSPFHAYAQWLEKKDKAFHDRLFQEGRKLFHVPEPYHMTTWATERVCSFVEQDRDPDKPFFCKMSLFDAHNPYNDYPLSWADSVDQSLIPGLVEVGDGRHYGPGYLHEQMIRCGADLYAQSDDVLSMRTGYYASIALIDKAVGQVLDALEQAGVTDNTIVMFISDHGDMLGDHGLFVKGAFFYDASVRVPFIIRYPHGIQAGIREQALVQTNDVAATALAAAGYTEAELNEWMPDSKDLIGWLQQTERSTLRDSVYCLYRNSGNPNQEEMFEHYVVLRYGDEQWGDHKQQLEKMPSGIRFPINATMMRTDRYKLSLYHNKTEGQEELHGELFDMQNDPQETRNLWKEAHWKDVKDNMVVQAQQWLNSHEDSRL
jgi:arylsulfatase